jgi:hypothetical protein
MVSSAFSPLSLHLWSDDAPAHSALLSHSDLADSLLHLESIFVMNKELAGWGLLSWKGRPFIMLTIVIIYIYIQICYFRFSSNNTYLTTYMAVFQRQLQIYPTCIQKIQYVVLSPTIKSICKLKVKFSQCLVRNHATTSYWDWMYSSMHS